MHQVKQQIPQTKAKQWLWFVGLYVSSVIAVASAAYGLRFFLAVS